MDLYFIQMSNFILQSAIYIFIIVCRKGSRVKDGESKKGTAGEADLNIPMFSTSSSENIKAQQKFSAYQEAH